MWHYIGTEEIISNDYRSGTYLVYDIDTLDYILNDKDWVGINDAFDEWDYIVDYLDYMLESDDGKYVYIPDAKTATRIEYERLIYDIETSYG